MINCFKKTSLNRDAFRFGLEKLMHKHNVDLAFWGHEHNYERSWPVFDKTVYKGSDGSHLYRNPIGTVHVVTGAAVRTRKLHMYRYIVW